MIRQEETIYKWNGEKTKITNDYQKTILNTNPSKSFKKFAELWLNVTASQLKYSSIIKYENIILTYLLPEFQNKSIESITTEEIDMFLHMLLTNGGKTGNGLSTQTVQCIFSVMKSILSFASRYGECNIPRTDKIVIRQSPKNLSVLSVKEQNILTDYIVQHNTLESIGILVCLYTGLRLGELCALKWSNIVLDEQYLYVEYTIQRLRNRDNSVQKTSLYLSPPKNNSSIRKVPLPSCLHNILISHQRDADMYLLTGTKKCMEPRTMENHFKSIMQICGIRNVKFHTLRHTFATRCVELGFDPKSLSEILGHSNVNITLNRYVHPSMELKQKNMDLLGVFLEHR